ncbi:FprA family A-type flavoprotein [Candidatus Bathyarchaeota archaeon]|nr:FprA family A-type flavoprotein [Candidatus Bathyarchaeota archaeon]
MNWRNIAQISKDIYWVGVRDWDRRLFDALIPLPKGTTYNSYFVRGSKKKALIDTVNPGFEIEWEQKIQKIADPADIDYVIMNHAEPDHAGSIPHIMQLNNKAMLITSAKGAKMAQTFYKVPENRIKAVADNETLDLGGKTLRFIEAPMLHWPETMFTYLVENKVLFSCDFFGSHIAQGLYDDEVEDLIVWAQRYFGEIMMPFRINAQKALEKIKPLELETIAPSHGPIHRNPKRILEAYQKWSAGETRKKAIIVYVSMWNSTAKMIQPIADVLTSEGIEVAKHNLANADIADLAKDLVDARAIILGAPTVLAGAHPLAVYATYLVKALRPSAKYAVALSSYGWAGGAIKHIQEALGSTKITILDALEINGPPNEEHISRIVAMGKVLAEKIKEEK